MSRIRIAVVVQVVVIVIALGFSGLFIIGAIENWKRAAQTEEKAAQMGAELAEFEQETGRLTAQGERNELFSSVQAAREALLLADTHRAEDEVRLLREWALYDVAKAGGCVLVAVWLAIPTRRRPKVRGDESDTLANEPPVRREGVSPHEPAG